VGAMSLLRSSSVAQNVATRSENTAKLSDSDTHGRIIKLAFELRNLAYSEAYLQNMIRARLSNVKSDFSPYTLVYGFLLFEN
jgi:hypothetical protein